MTASSSASSSAFWLGVLLRQFPELNRELAPSRTARPAAERTPRSGRPPSAPIRLFVSDTIRDITDGVVELEEAVCDRLRLPHPPRGTVEQRLLRLLALLDRGITADPLLADHVRAESRRMARRCSRALGDAETPVRVRGRCPHCDSVSLRVFPHRETVLCINPGCRCADPSCTCTTDDRHRHAWPRDRWQQLTETIAADLTELTAAADEEDSAG
ncbi:MULTISPECIES: hypothetical protein [Streptomyces]|uniref:Uncharacterized protein n=1 Tax=Streptomyces morookaense TaxID=1970 RepID=A0A7Y7B6Q1_STRMO|nr:MULTISPECIES: hypothetical protein [Streptomyces]MCC2279659.1 hypothetical protein [Streptomyces sp. ET3-23]NVK79586.1 hypothetical protein [Streptomyces morookaense]GHF48010.1 hypothetical protein GCM10010359_57800 [Streptomyces morookaense]